jgi:hypothetical protein
MKERQCKCGGAEFTASQRCYHDIIVNGDNIFLRNVSVFESERPYGAYTCTQCNTEYEDLDGLVEAEVDISGPAESATASEIVPAHEQYKVTKAPRQTIHISWDGLGNLFNNVLTSLLNRDIRVDVQREEYYYWKAVLHDPLTLEELEKLFELFQASDHDMDANDFGEYPIMELSEGLCKKLMAKLIPFKLDSTRADDDGVWFIGNETQKEIVLALPNDLSFVVKIGGDTDYPGVFTYLKQLDGQEDIVCFAEFNSSRPEGKEICVGAYAHNIDDPTYYASYHDDGVPWE